MSDMKPKHATVTLGGKEYGLLFSVNAIDEIQDHFDIPISELTKLLQNERTAFKAVRFLLTTLINEAIDDAESGEPHVNERFIGRKIDVTKMNDFKIGIFKSMTNGIPEPDEDDIPNAKSE